MRESLYEEVLEENLHATLLGEMLRDSELEEKYAGYKGMIETLATEGELMIPFYMDLVVKFQEFSFITYKGYVESADGIVSFELKLKEFEKSELYKETLKKLVAIRMAEVIPVREEMKKLKEKLFLKEHALRNACDELFQLEEMQLEEQEMKRNGILIEDLDKE